MNNENQMRLQKEKTEEQIAEFAKRYFTLIFSSDQYKTIGNIEKPRRSVFIYSLYAIFYKNLSVKQQKKFILVDVLTSYTF